VRVAVSVLVTIFVEVVKIVRRIVAVAVAVSVAVVVIVVGMVAVVVIVAVLVSVTVVVVVVAKVIALGHSLKYITSSTCGLLNTGAIELTVGVMLVMFWGVRELTVGVTVDGVYVSATAVAGYDRRLVGSPPLVNPVVIIQSFWVEAANPCCQVPGWCNATEKERSPAI